MAEVTFGHGRSQVGVRVTGSRIDAAHQRPAVAVTPRRTPRPDARSCGAEPAPKPKGPKPLPAMEEA